MTRLSNAEIDCLRRIADEPSTDAPPCPDDILKRLQDLGLVEYEPKLWTPLEAVDVRYHLTDTGRELLNRLNEGFETSRDKEDE